MASEGWIRLHRCIRSCWIWDNPIKLKWWIDILLMANHTGKKINLGGKLVEIEKGSFHTSILKLSERWGVDRKTVTRFLDVLERDEMITTDRTTLGTKRGTTIKVSNYNDYQGFSSGVKDNQGDNQGDINNNEKNEENEKKEYIDLKFVDEVIEKVKLTQEQYNKLINKYDKEYVHKEILGLDNYIINGKGAKYKDHYRTLNTWLRTRKAPAPKEDRHYGFNG